MCTLICIQIETQLYIQSNCFLIQDGSAARTTARNLYSLLSLGTVERAPLQLKELAAKYKFKPASGQPTASGANAWLPAARLAALRTKPDQFGAPERRLIETIGNYLAGTSPVGSVGLEKAFHPQPSALIGKAEMSREMDYVNGHWPASGDGLRPTDPFGDICTTARVVHELITLHHGSAKSIPIWIPVFR